MARRKPVVSPRAVPPDADEHVEVRPREEAREMQMSEPLDPPDPEPDDDDDEESEDEPIGDEPSEGFRGFADDRGPAREHARFPEPPDASFDDDEPDYEPAWPGGPRVSHTAAASAGLGAVPTFDPDHPPLPRVPLVGMNSVDEQLRSRSFGHGNGGYDEREFARMSPRPPPLGAPQVSLGGPLPMWPDQADFDMQTQIVVKRREVDGSLANLGPFPKDATIDMLLAKYPNPGTYYVFPVDAMGREFDRANPTRIDIPADHEFFKRKKTLESMSPATQVLAAAGGSQVAAPEFLALVEKMFAQKDAEAARLAAEVRARQDELAEREKSIRERDQALAVREIEHVTTASKDLLAAANSQFAGIIAMMQTMNAAQVTHAEAAAERERLRLEASHKAQMEMSQQTSKLMFEQFTEVTKMHNTAAERERERDKAALEAEKARLAEETKLRATFMSAEEKRRQEVFATQQAVEKKGGLAGISETLETYAKLKELMGGTEPETGESGKAWWETAAEMFAEAQRMKHEMRIEKMRARAGYPQGVPLPPDLMDDDDDVDSDDVPAIPPQPALRGPNGLPAQWPQQAQQRQQAPGPPPFAGLGTPMPAELKQAVPPPAPAVPAVQPPVQSLAAPDATGAATPGFDWTFADAKRMTQMTIDRLAQEPNRQAWPDLVASAIIAVPSMLDYFKAETVYGAMMENGADPSLAEEVCVAAGPVAAQNGIPIR